MTTQRPQFVLFGDSITQKSFAPERGWGTTIADVYQRRVDVINRGYSGYNTRWALKILDDVFPSPLTDGTPLPTLVTIFFGANDAALPSKTSARQHVPLPEFGSNMRSIITHLQSRCSIPHIILITPPPVHEPGRIAHALATYNITLEASERSNAHTELYANAVIGLGKELGLPVVDLWHGFQEKRQDDWGVALLNDGLHLTPEGNALVADMVVETIATSFEGVLSVQAMEVREPEWAEWAVKEPGDESEQDAGILAYLQSQISASKK